jgi:hypothetical protein
MTALGGTRGTHFSEQSESAGRVVPVPPVELLETSLTGVPPSATPSAPREICMSPEVLRFRRIEIRAF